MYRCAVLFVYREVPEESLGFSPFELVYGRAVRGPITIFKELWTKDVPDPNVKTTYLSACHRFKRETQNQWQNSLR